MGHCIVRWTAGPLVVPLVSAFCGPLKFAGGAVRKRRMRIISTASRASSRAQCASAHRIRDDETTERTHYGRIRCHRRQALRIQPYERENREPALGHKSGHGFLRRAYELWRETETLAGEQLLWITGSLDRSSGLVNSSTSPCSSTVWGNGRSNIGASGSAIIDGALASCRLHGLDHEPLGAADGALSRLSSAGKFRRAPPA